MKILLLTPLFPPDTEPSARYMKMLAGRLATTHTVTVLTYGHLPERVPEVTIIAQDKRRPLPLRILSFTFALLKAAGEADVIYAENGPSVELPLALCALIQKVPFVVHVGDTAAEERGEQDALLSTLHAFVLKRARHVVRETPSEPPEILPLEPAPDSELALYLASWNLHVHELNTILTHGAST